MAQVETETEPEALVDVEVAPPLLEPGDHLTREEFERRYSARLETRKAELIEGVVHMAFPVRVNHHGSPHAAFMGWLFLYWAHTTGVRVGDNVSVRLDGDNMPQPDGVLFIDRARGGQTTLGADDYIEGGPELVVEVAASTASIDLNTKFRVYRRNNVREYLVWRVLDRAIDWFVLRQGRYERLASGPDGISRSEVFPGLWLDPEALAKFDLIRVLDVAKLGIAGPEHAAFVAKLGGVAGV